MDYSSHWQAIYDAIEVALADAGLSEVTIAAVHSQDSQTAGEALEPPYVIYSQERERGTGTPAGGPNKVAEAGWRITARARDLEDILAIATAITTKFEAEDVDDTVDGYVTTAIELVGAQTLWEMDSKLHAFLLRFNWERSK